ncbi:MAG TPA: hypothetical protein VMT53_14345 [Terriglobales bacterium]|nr:hypothetical protein [Terriglobales bacterium]
MDARLIALLIAFALFASHFGVAQQSLGGTVLPMMLSTSLDFSKSKPGDRVRGRLMQAVATPSGENIPAGAKVFGKVLEVSPASANTPARMVVEFSQLVYDRQAISIRASLRAIASMQDVFAAQLPVGTFDEYGTTTADWTTVQVGGAAVYLGDATVRDGMQIIGKAPGYGIVLAELIPAPKRGCPAVPGGGRREQSLWVFSPWACGAYGFEGLTINRSATTARGAIELTAPLSTRIRAGSGWLLEVLQTTATEVAPAS